MPSQISFSSILLSKHVDFVRARQHGLGCRRVKVDWGQFIASDQHSSALVQGQAWWKLYGMDIFLYERKSERERERQRQRQRQRQKQRQTDRDREARPERQRQRQRQRDGQRDGQAGMQTVGQAGKKTDTATEGVCLLVGCLTSQQHASVSQERICSDNCMCCHTEIEVADPTFYLTQSQYTDTGPTSPSADPITPGAWQGSHWSANFWVTGMTRPRKNSAASGIRTRDLPLSRRTPYH